MKLEAVVVCLNYADYLHHTLPYSKLVVDDLLVMTGVEDEETQLVCQHHGVRCLATDAFIRYAGPFNKGAAINEGLSALKREDWLLILDADILLPAHIRPFLETARLKTECLYGADRRNCDGVDSLQRSGFSDLPMLQRVCILGGYPPPGYFQLFHTSAISHGPWYEDHYGAADRTDIVFAKRFPSRSYLPTWVVHLDCGGHVGGVNWGGRKSPRFVSHEKVKLDLGLAVDTL